MTLATRAPSGYDPSEEFEAQRSRLFGLAYRMTGSVVEAEDLVQEAYLRFAALNHIEVRSSGALLTTIVTRLAMDHMRSARVRREQYVGEWLPEPLPTSNGVPGPEDSIELRESIELAFLILLERLSPVERAVLLLHDVFGYGHREVAGIVDRSEPACRQTLHRARERLREPRQRYRCDYTERKRVMLEFLRAATEGDMAGLLAVLSADVIEYGDGGGVVSAGLHPIYGRDKVLRLLIGGNAKEPAESIELIEVNGAPAFLRIAANGRPPTVLVFQVAGGKIFEIQSIRNPAKLTAILPRRSAHQIV